MKPEEKKLGIYVHVPFCKSKCAYCDFYSLPHAEERMEEYVKAVSAHLTETAPIAAHHTVDTIYFGGGTPTLLGSKSLKELLAVIQKKYRVDKKAEITFEANPDSACDWKELRTLRKAGFNRISLGMQSACDEELKEIGRVHTFDQVRAAVEAARKAKFDNLSLDLIYGLPHQTMDRWKANLQAALDLAPQHLSCYGLTLEEGTPLYLRRDDAMLPGDEAQADFYLYTVDTLLHYGYPQYEISNFARPGYESRHNLKYWTLGEYAGFGPGAHSDFGGVRYAYERDLDVYIKGVLEGAPMLSESERIPQLDRDTEYLMLGLRTVRGLRPQEFESRYRRLFSCIVPFLEECRTAGYAVCEADGSWHLTPQGFLVSNQIIGGVLDALGKDKVAKAAAAARGDYRIDVK
ncbi:MAG: radical SAM family heme chaperone HemW [Oscillibacter sp.]|jgi:oxygen-independent coproporphyrinogen-3 oxidase|nr:radical SAM family heme chaperone HemW [Oscillibacter sp.]